MKLLATWLLIGMTHCLFGQDTLITTYQDLLKTFNEQKNIAYEADYLFYESLESKTTSHQMHINTWLTQADFYVVADAFEVLYENQQSVLIDHTSQVIQLKKTANPQLPTVDISTFSSLVNLFEMEGTAFEAANGLKGIKFIAASPSKMAIELLYEPISKRIASIKAAFDFSTIEGFVYEFDQTIIEAKFYNYRTDSASLPKAMTEMVRFSGNKALGIGQYKDYQIIQ